MIITVQCPSCETSFPVDPRKVPDGGVKVRCSSCSGIFFVDKPEIPSVADLAPSAPPAEQTSAGVPAPAPPPAEAAPLAEAARAAVEAPEVAETVAEPREAAEPVAEAPEVAETVAEPREATAAAAEVPEAAEPVAEALEDAAGDGEWDESGFEDPSHGVHHDHGSADPWSGGVDLPDADAAPAIETDPTWGAAEPAAEYEPVSEAPEPVIERLETVEDVTRAAAADFPRDVPVDDPDDAWGDPTPAAEAPVDVAGDHHSAGDAGGAAGSVGHHGFVEEDEGPDDSFGDHAAAEEADAPIGASSEPEMSDSVEGSGHESDSGGNVEVAAPPVAAPAPPVAAPAPSKFQFGRRDPDDKARRLARVLVSDIITYNPERHQRALEQDTLHADFEDEIRKSWAEYVEQVGRERAESTPYWFDALNEILARGRKVF